MLEFYDDLTSVIRNVPAHNFLTVLGDFNARLGPDDARFTLHDQSNRNGVLLAELLVENQLLAANTLFEKRRGNYGPTRIGQLEYNVNSTIFL